MKKFDLKELNKFIRSWDTLLKETEQYLRPLKGGNEYQRGVQTGSYILLNDLKRFKTKLRRELNEKR